MEAEVARLNAIKEVCKKSYASNLEYLEERLARVNIQLERTTSVLKRDILTKQKEHYENQLTILDENVENAIKEVDTNIENLEKNMKEKTESFDYNIEKLQECIKRRHTSDIFDMFENVTNALIILAREISE